MKKETISAMVPAKGEAPQLGPVSIEVNVGETATESIQMFGDDAVNSNALANWRVTVQGAIRSGLKKGETAAAIQARLADAKMGVSVKGAQVDPVQAYLATFAAATPEKQKQMLAELQARAGKK